MIRADVSDYLVFKHMPSGRHVFALTRTRGIVVDKLGGSSPLVPIIDDSLALGREALRIALAWQSAKKREADKSRGEALPLKQRIARRLSSSFSILQGRTDGDDVVVVNARNLMTTVFQNGVADISIRRSRSCSGRSRPCSPSTSRSRSPAT